EVLSKNPDVNIILTDWNMPNMNGLEFLTKVRETNKEIPIVMVTTEAEKQNVVTAIKAGANNYIVKPFTPEVLKEKIGQFLT
ncbi:MAG: response regulator, partial [Planctomycetota bacterium]